MKLIYVLAILTAMTILLVSTNKKGFSFLIAISNGTIYFDVIFQTVGNSDANAHNESKWTERVVTQGTLPYIFVLHLHRLDLAILDRHWRKGQHGKSFSSSVVYFCGISTEFGLT